MLDLTSALYLGQEHAGLPYDGWPSLTTGRPAVLGDRGRELARELASRAGTQDGLLAPSTLHALTDAVLTLTDRHGLVVVDRYAYPTTHLAAGLHRARGGTVVTAGHHDVDDVARLLDRPGLLLVDGWCPGCGRPAPLRQLADVVRRRGSLLVVDDTQAFGVLGRDPSQTDPYGTEGGGLMAWTGISDEAVVTVSSLAKGLGVPVAFVGASRPVTRRLEVAPSRMHGSPPSGAHLTALACVLGRRLDQARRRLFSLVQRLRGHLRQLGLRCTWSSMPAQQILLEDGRQALELVDRLQRRGIRVVAVDPRCRRTAGVALMVRSDLSVRDIDRVAHALSEARRAA